MVKPSAKLKRLTGLFDLAKLIKALHAALSLA